MDHREQIVIYLYCKIQELREKVKEDQLTKEDLLNCIEMMEELLRDYFNLTD